MWMFPGTAAHNYIEFLEEGLHVPGVFILLFANKVTDMCLNYYFVKKYHLVEISSPTS